MANKEKIDHLLSDIKELEKLIAGVQEADLYPVSFFSQTFELSHKIINDLHNLETAQVERLRKQMEEHQKLIQSIPLREAVEIQPMAAPLQPETKEPEREEPQPVEPQPAATVVEQPKETEQPKEAEQPVATKKPAPQPIVSEKAGISLNEIIEKKNLSDFRKAFSLNDRFRFRRELFEGDEEKMNRTITALNDIHSYEESMDYLHNTLNWNIDDPAVADFIKLLEKRFL